MVAALSMLALLSTHMVLLHLSGLLRAVGIDLGDVRSFAAVMERGRAAGQMVFYVLFLGAALFHGMYGLRSVLMEVIPARRLPLLTGAVVLLGLAAFAYGAYVTVRTFTG